MAKSKKVYTYASPRGWARAVVIVMAINLVLLVALSLMTFAYGNDTYYAAEVSLTPVQWVLGLISLAYVLVLVASTVNFVWIYRVNANAHAFSRRPQVSPIGAILWYFVPIAFLFKPFQAMEETWDASASERRRGAPPLLLAWWILFLLDNFIGWIALILNGSDMHRAALAISYLAGAVVTVLWILVVRQITSMQLRMHSVSEFGEAPQALAAEGTLDRYLGA
ncbi:MAG: DUF4328 domain-containing protein [Caulobacteraceae bacterium]